MAVKKNYRKEITWQTKKSTLEPAVANSSTPCRQATPKTALWPLGRLAVFYPIDTPCHTPLLEHRSKNKSRVRY
jgi:hypothetical protein